ncbi:hypothetical protein LIER_16343 [Lithospermum erythrorhizon]|uniref:Uncharacterized protein n=1 Tax=Lithospermum erythrorhizon TaxID=34254 RepID=A0AAV3Q6A4_LITER
MESVFSFCFLRLTSSPFFFRSWKSPFLSVNIELVDTGGSPKCLAIKVAESHPPAPPALSIPQEAKAILRTGASSFWACICDGLQGKSPEIVLKEEERAMETFGVHSAMGLGDVAHLRGML